MGAFCAFLRALLDDGGNNACWASALDIDSLMRVRSAIHTTVETIADYLLLASVPIEPCVAVPCARALGAWLLEEVDDGLEVRMHALRALASIATLGPHSVVSALSHDADAAPEIDRRLFDDYPFAYALPAFLQLIDDDSPLAAQTLLRDDCARGLLREAVVGLEHYFAAIGSQKTLPPSFAPVVHALRCFDAVRLLWWIKSRDLRIVESADADRSLAARLDAVAVPLIEESTCRRELFGDDDDDEDDEEDSRAWRMIAGSACWLASAVRGLKASTSGSSGQRQHRCLSSCSRRSYIGRDKLVVDK